MFAYIHITLAHNILKLQNKFLQKLRSLTQRNIPLYLFIESTSKYEKHYDLESWDENLQHTDYTSLIERIDVLSRWFLVSELHTTAP